MPVTDSCVGPGYSSFTTQRQVPLALLNGRMTDVWLPEGSRQTLTNGAMKAVCRRSPDGNTASLFSMFKASAANQMGVAS